jgi:hypothetical protein
VSLQGVWIANRIYWTLLSSSSLAVARLQIPTMFIVSIIAGSCPRWLATLSHLTYCSNWRLQSQSHVTTDGQSASLSWYQATIWDLRPDFYYCQTAAGLLMWCAFFDERTVCRLQLLLALASAVTLGPESRGTNDHISLSQDSRLPNLEDQVILFISPGTGWPSYTHRHWVTFSSPPTASRVTVEVFEPTSTRGHD